MPVINRAGMSSITPESESSKQKSAAAGGYDINTLRQRADSLGDQSDDYKYQIAVELARSDLGNRADSDQDLFQDRIDQYLEDLGATKSGDEFRGENWFTQGVEAVDGFIDDVTGFGGAAIDGLFDNTIGNIGSMLGYGDKWKDAFDADDMSIIADAALDLGLSAIPGIGMGLAAAKNMVQSGDAWKEFLSGRDSTTLERQTGWQTAGNGLTAALGVLGSVVPGFGKTRQLMRASDLAGEIGESAAREGAEELAQSAAKEALESGGEAAAKSAAKETAETVAGKASSEAAEEAGNRGIFGAVDRIKGNIGNVRDRSGQLRDEGHGIQSMWNSLTGYPRAVSEGLMPYTSRESRLLRNVIQAEDAAEAAAMSEAAESTMRGRLKNFAAQIPSALARNIVPGVGGAIVGTMADTGLNPVQSATTVFTNAANGDLGWVFPMMTNVGLNSIGARMPNPRGTISNTNMPVMAARGFANADYARNNPSNREANAANDNIDTRGFTEQELLDFLEYAERMNSDD